MNTLLFFLRLTSPFNKCIMKSLNSSPIIKYFIYSVISSTLTVLSFNLIKRMRPINNKKKSYGNNSPNNNFLIIKDKFFKQSCYVFGRYMFFNNFYLNKMIMPKKMVLCGYQNPLQMNKKLLTRGAKIGLYNKASSILKSLIV